MNYQEDIDLFGEINGIIPTILMADDIKLF